MPRYEQCPLFFWGKIRVEVIFKNCSPVQWLTEGTRAPESPPSLPGDQQHSGPVPPLRVLWLYPSPNPSPAGKAWIRDENSGEVWNIKRRFCWPCSHLTCACGQRAVPERCVLSLGGLPAERENILSAWAGNISFPTQISLCSSLWTCGKCLFFCSQAQWWIPAALRWQGGEGRTRGQSDCCQQRSTKTLLRLALEQVLCVGTTWGGPRVAWALQETTKGRRGSKGQSSGHFQQWHFAAQMRCGATWATWTCCTHKGPVSV